MNYIKAACGHYVIAVGAPGSAARICVEKSPCVSCDTPDYWQREYDSAVPIPMSQDEIDKIVDYVMKHANEDT